MFINYIFQWKNECEIKASLDIKKYTKKQYLREFVVRLTLQKNIKEVFRLNVTSDSNSNWYKNPVTI